MAKKQLSLKPVEAALKSIVKQLENEITRASDKKKPLIVDEICKIKALIAQVPPSCRKYNVG
ncbi:MAG: hypothetical protein WBW14_05830 [Candidatus Acidiferrum sp.]|jgi:hypothetical protein|nr:hypothetical protein [Candidatus Acidoferrum sp.]